MKERNCMETIYLNPGNLALWQQRAKPNVMALGFFDGVHKGHREVIQTALAKAKEKNLLLSVMSFFPHPKTVLSNGNNHFDYLMPLSDKRKLLAQLGVDIFYIVEFDHEFSLLPPEVFVKKYLMNLGVVHAVAGFDYCYGKMGKGNMDRLNADSGGLLKVTKVDKVECNGEKISSTCIREKLANGNVEELPKLLGQRYAIECIWNGVSLKTRPYYTLPAPGRYAVTVVGGPCTFETEVIVTEEKELILLSRMYPIYKGLRKVIWNQRIEAEKEGSVFKWTRDTDGIPV
jgi:riboflavin kinase/FMN adenylyltransferase